MDAKRAELELKGARSVAPANLDLCLIGFKVLTYECGNGGQKPERIATFDRRVLQQLGVYWVELADNLERTLVPRSHRIACCLESGGANGAGAVGPARIRGVA